jgi:hypothetical protein
LYDIQEVMKSRYFFSKSEEFLSFILEIENKSSTFLSKLKKNMTILRMNYFVIHYLFQKNNFKMKGNSNVSSKQKILK